MIERSLSLFSSASTFPEARGWLGHLGGWCLAPDYANAADEVARWPMPCMIDNGAWTDFTHGRSSRSPEMLERTVALADRAVALGLPVEFCVLPDAVGDWTRTAEMLQAVRRPDEHRWALPLQDGFTPGEVENQVARFRPDYLFIGGSGMAFKRSAVAYARTLDLPIHVGRVAQFPDLCEMARTPGVVSVDTSTYARPDGPERVEELGRRLEVFAAYLAGEQSGLEAWGVC